MKRNHNNRIHKPTVFGVVNTLFLIFITLIMLYPFWHVLMGSLSTTSAMFDGGISLFPKELNFGAYKYLLGAPNIHRAFLNSVFVTVVGTFLSMILTYIGAYVLSKKDLPYRKQMTFFVVFTMLFSGGMIPIYLQVNRLGLIDSIWALILPTMISPYNMVVMRNFLIGIPHSLEESAELDGAGQFTIMCQIFIPLSKAVIATITLFYAVSYWNAFFNGVIYLNNPDNWTLQVLLQQIVQESNSELLELKESNGGQGVVPENLKMALVIVATVPIAAVYPFLQRYFTKGVLVGSVKG